MPFLSRESIGGSELPADARERGERTPRAKRGEGEGGPHEGRALVYPGEYVKEGEERRAKEERKKNERCMPSYEKGAEWGGAYAHIATASMREKKKRKE